MKLFTSKLIILTRYRFLSLRGLLAATVILLMGGCNSFLPSFETPSVTISSFRLLPATTINPKFEIGLHVVNPNRSALALQGLVYTASIEGHRVLTGASNDLPVIAAYGEGDIVVNATPDLLGGFRLLNDVMTKQRNALNYQLAIKLDIGDFLPAIKVAKEGQIVLVAP